MGVWVKAKMAKADHSAFKKRAIDCNLTMAQAAEVALRQFANDNGEYGT